MYSLPGKVDENIGLPCFAEVKPDDTTVKVRYLLSGPMIKIINPVFVFRKQVVEFHSSTGVDGTVSTRQYNFLLPNPGLSYLIKLK